MKTWIWIMIIVAIGVASWVTSAILTKKRIELMHGSGGFRVGSVPSIDQGFKLGSQ